MRTGANVETFPPVAAKFVRFTVRACDGEPCLDELEAFTAEAKPRNVALASAGAIAAASSTLPGYAIHQVAHVNDGRYGNDRSWISNEPGRGSVAIEFAKAETIDRVVWSRDRTEPPRYADRLAADYVVEVSKDGKGWTAVADGKDRGGPGANAYVGRFAAPGPTFRLHRGDPADPREKVDPGVPAQIGPQRAVPADATEQGRRVAFAEWVVDVKNPLTARVIVNRLWQWHFGTGLVDTPSDLGRNGAAPSHPELLDWLASELVAAKWSLKHVHRLIVTSATYRQASAGRADGRAKDAGTRLLWRYPPQRLEAEALRDAVLATSGKLDRTMGGPGFDLFESNGNYVKVYDPKKAFGPETFRRMVYQSKPRMHVDDTFGAFDCPDGGQVAPKRSRSTTPLQALNLLNAPFVLDQAAFFADRLTKERAGDAPRIARGFELAFGRPPDEDEAAAAAELVRGHGLRAFCRALFNANEFLTIR